MIIINIPVDETTKFMEKYKFSWRGRKYGWHNPKLNRFEGLIYLIIDQFGEIKGWHKMSYYKYYSNLFNLNDNVIDYKVFLRKEKLKNI